MGSSGEQDPTNRHQNLIHHRPHHGDSDGGGAGNGHVHGRHHNDHDHGHGRSHRCGLKGSLYFDS